MSADRRVLRRNVDLAHNLHGHVLDFVSDTDRAWFAAHPGQTSYLREALEHEFCDPSAARTGRCESLVVAPENADLIVLVTRLADGIRSRKPVYWIYKPKGAV